VVVPWLAVGWGWRVAYGLTAVPALVTLALVALLVRRGPLGAVGTPVGLAGLRRVLATPAIWPINLSVLLAFGGYVSFLTFLPAFLVKDLGLSEPGAGFVTSLITGGSVLSYPVAGIISDRLGARKPIYLTSVAVAIAVCATFALAGRTLGARYAWTLALGAGILLGGMIQPFVIVMDLFPPSLAATASGVANGSCFVGAMVLPIVLGRVVDLTGDFTSAFLVAAGVGVLALAVALTIGETGRRPGGEARAGKEKMAR
jgi:ACS family hexuronate transporter-like MFS transporter